MRLFAHNSLTVVFPPDCRNCSARLPHSYAEDMNRMLSAPHTGGVMLNPPHGCRCLQSSSPLSGSSPTMSSAKAITSWSCPSTLISVGVENERRKVCFFQTTAPVYRSNDISDCPTPPTMTITLFLYTSGLHV